MISNYYIENRHFYVEGFAKHMQEDGMQDYYTKEINYVFKWWLMYYKNIEADMRTKFWQGVRNDALKLAGYKFNNGYWEAE